MSEAGPGTHLQEFVSHYNAIDSHFRQVLDVPVHEKRLGFRQLLSAYKQRNPWWQDDTELHQMADLRNVLTHSFSGKPFCLPTSAAVERIGQIYERLTRPSTLEQTCCQRDVLTVVPGNTLSDILGLIRDNDFSQFPVYHGEEFVGLVTENGIARWLAHHGAAPNPATVTVANLLAVHEQYHTDTSPAWGNAEFMEPNTLADQATYRFRVNPILEAILVRPSTRASQKPCGIMTRWDALRFSSFLDTP